MMVLGGPAAVKGQQKSPSGAIFVENSRWWLYFPAENSRLRLGGRVVFECGLLSLTEVYYKHESRYREALDQINITIMMFYCYYCVSQCAKCILNHMRKLEPHTLGDISTNNGPYVVQLWSPEHGMPTWFTSHLIYDLSKQFLSTLWPPTLVSSLLQHSVMFSLYIKVQFRVK